MEYWLPGEEMAASGRRGVPSMVQSVRSDSGAGASDGGYAIDAGA